MMFGNDRQTRRDVLRGTAGIGAISIAGCLGGDGGDQVDLTVGSSSSGSSTYGNSQAIQRVVSQESDYLNFITQDAGGDPNPSDCTLTGRSTPTPRETTS